MRKTAQKNPTIEDYFAYMGIVNGIIKGTEIKTVNLSRLEKISKLEFQDWLDWQNGKEIAGLE